MWPSSRKSDRRARMSRQRFMFRATGGTGEMMTWGLLKTHAEFGVLRGSPCSCEGSFSINRLDELP